jgi:hypothetical protein
MLFLILLLFCCRKKILRSAFPVGEWAFYLLRYLDPYQALKATVQCLQ